MVVRISVRSLRAGIWFVFGVAGIDRFPQFIALNFLELKVIGRPPGPSNLKLAQ